MTKMLMVNNVDSFVGIKTQLGIGCYNLGYFVRDLETSTIEHIFLVTMEIPLNNLNVRLRM